MKMDEGVLGAYIHELETIHEQEAQPERVLNEMELLEEEQLANIDLIGGRATASAAEKFLLPMMMETEEFTTHMRSLNVKQRRIVNHILHKLKRDNSPFHIYLSGGVGKSHVITAVVQGFLRYCNTSKEFDADSLPVLVCAPTGKAAFNVFGMTPHSAFHLPCNQSGTDMGKLDEGLANTLRIKFKHLRLIIIDEISMVSYKQLLLIDQRLRQIFDSTLPFGGVSILTVGHFRQLLPIPGGSSSFVFKSDLPPLRNFLWELFEFCELDEIMRQKGDWEFCRALNNMAEGKMKPEDTALFKSLEITEERQPPEDAIWLFKTNDECDLHNDALHDKMTTERAVSVAFDEVTGDASANSRKKLLEDAKSWKRTQSDGMPYECKLQIGGLYFVTTNIDVPDGLFNGATGTLRKIDYGRIQPGLTVPKAAWIEFTHPLIGSSARGKLLRNPNQEEGSDKWTPINRIKRALTKSYKCKGMTLYRENLPLHACNGMTIAKSQGSSLTCVVVYVKKTLTREALYVACSRATSKSRLYIDGEFKPPRDPVDKDDVSMEMAVLRNNPVNFDILSFVESKRKFRLYFQNVRSFPKYKGDLCCDQNIMQSTHILLVEPHVLDNFNVHLPGFQCFSRQNSQLVNNTTNSVGFLLFSKSGSEVVRIASKQEGRKHYLLVSFEIGDCTVITSYKHPNFNSSLFLEDLKSFLEQIVTRDIILVGDLNINMNEHSAQLTEFFQGFDMWNKLGNNPSTDSGSQIDVCFARHNGLEASVYETYISDHSGICFAW